MTSHKQLKMLKALLRNIQPRRKEQVVKSKKNYKRVKFNINSDFDKNN